MKKIFILVVGTFSIFGCWPEIFKDRNGKFLSDVVPLDDFNSAFDDYNSDLPKNKSGRISFTFSSKRDKKIYFNLVSFEAQFSYGKRLGLHTFRNGETGAFFTDYDWPGEFLSKVNGNFNVLGPKTVSLRDDFQSFGDSPKGSAVFYADDSGGDLDIKYVRKTEAGIEEPVSFDLLNSTKDDGYPSFSWLGDKIYFSSNREGNFDIYEVSIPRGQNERITLESLVTPKEYQIRKVEELSGPFDDKCPYIYGHTMVFVSDRPGGKGGSDIYYSTLENNKWSVPVNAGSRINTSYNEYRPILPDLVNFNYNLMIFSSDRPGGKGGFDLYMTGLNDKFK